MIVDYNEEGSGPRLKYWKVRNSGSLSFDRHVAVSIYCSKNTLPSPTHPRLFSPAISCDQLFYQYLFFSLFLSQRATDCRSRHTPIFNFIYSFLFNFYFQLLCREAFFILLDSTRSALFVTIILKKILVFFRLISEVL